jgi:retron-type reverse transcriptase
VLDSAALCSPVRSDEESIRAFEANLAGNLYKLWNRLCSGSYMPPPVRAVEIPKRSGGSRVFGVPTVADRVAQTVVRLYLEPTVEPCFHPDSYGVPAATLGLGGGGALPGAVLAIRLGDRS